MNETKRYVVLAAAIIIIAGGVYYFESRKAGPGNVSGDTDIKLNEAPTFVNGEVGVPTAERVGKKAKQYETAKEISSPDGFINTPRASSGQAEPITVQELIGKKVILVDFWTYSCINCQRTTPYLNAWYEKYADKGLEILGVHTPEFEFEKDYENVKKAVEKFNINYPVILDNDYSTWTAYKNRYWPRKYLIDIDGFIVYDHIGEGGYEETERKIQEALTERAMTLGMKETIIAETTTPDDAEHVDAGMPRSPEVYFGASRNEFLMNGVPNTTGAHTLTIPSEIRLNALYLGGTWNIGEEYAENVSRDARIVFGYEAQKVFFVASAENPVQVRVMKDGVLVQTITVHDSQLYRLIEDTASGEHALELIIESPGLKAFTFTFG